MTYLGEGGLGSIHIYDIIHVLVTYCQYTYITCAKQALVKLCLPKLTRITKGANNTHLSNAQNFGLLLIADALNKRSE